jgi:hypothetical protein
MTGPIRPEQVGGLKGKYIPAFVFEVFNDEIARHLSNGLAKVKQETVVARLVELQLNRQEIFDKGYLNIEEAYQAVGWTVSYDKPGYNESGEAMFTFRLPRGQ